MKNSPVDVSRGVSSGRPTYHVVAPRGWMNDPCAPGYDPNTRLYHLFYQWNPHSHFWNDISWGHATSHDLLHWKHKTDQPALLPDKPYDCRGIFTGCFIPSGPLGEEGGLTVVYTSVNHLPIAWDSSYERGCEGLSAATSVDGGKSWEKLPQNPILSEEPPNLDVTGFRDPFVMPWPRMDTLRGSDPLLYGLVSGGIRKDGPQVFLYAISPNNLTTWTYLHPLIADVPQNFRPSEKWSGDCGVNWECTNLIPLASNGIERDIVITGAEGGKEWPWLRSSTTLTPSTAKRTTRYLHWFFGTLRGQEAETRLHLDTAGLLDWGLFYAANSFIAADGRILLWGWVIEEDLPDNLLAQKGWIGCLGVPREVFLQVHRGVSGTLVSNLQDIKSFEVLKGDKKQAVATLGIRPMVEIEGLRSACLYTHPGGAMTPMQSIVDSAPLSCEIDCVIHVLESTQSFSFVVRHNHDHSIRTSITFRPREETITVDRSSSTTQKDINTEPEVAPHTLLRFEDVHMSGDHVEPLRLRVFLDHDVIEVFANDRFALATRVYTKGQYTGISMLSEGRVRIEALQVWSMSSACG